jgi:hypothetical protein
VKVEDPLLHLQEEVAEELHNLHNLHNLLPAVRSRRTWSDVDIRAAVTGPYWDPLDADRLLHGLFIDGMF